jgi:flagellar basal body-associated protein FliL
MDTTIVVLSIIIAVLIGGFVTYLLWAQRKLGQLESEKKAHTEALQMQITAYERLTVFTERIRLNALVNRLYDSSLSNRQMQQLLLNNIRDEYEHNVTQQLYIRPEIWEAVSKMKDQNSYIINQLAALAPSSATALDLNKKILEFSMNNPESTMNQLVLDAMQFEVKKILETRL